VDSAEEVGSVSELNVPTSGEWELAFRALSDLLAKHSGCVSTVSLVRELKKRLGTDEVWPLVVALKSYTPESGSERGVPAPGFTFRHLGRSFYSEERYADALRQEDTTAAEAEDASLEAPTEVQDELRAPPRVNRQEEARLVTYVKGKLEDLYESDDTPEHDYVFDVHSDRKGANFENVDLLAVHWRSRNVCELVTVEVKLEFTPFAVQQALNYTRFSHRVWVAVRVDSDYFELPTRDPKLFDYAISRGLGILACRRRQGGRYDVVPVHWPLRNQIDPLEEERFLDRYREQLEEAEAVERHDRKRFPRFR